MAPLVKTTSMSMTSSVPSITSATAGAVEHGVRNVELAGGLHHVLDLPAAGGW